LNVEKKDEPPQPLPLEQIGARTVVSGVLTTMDMDIEDHRRGVVRKWWLGLPVASIPTAT